jgi:hypothetical protein
MQRFTIYWGHDLEQEVLNVNKFDKSIFNKMVKGLEALVAPSSITEWDRIISGAVRVASPRIIPGRLASWWDNSLSNKRVEIRSIECRLKKQNQDRDPARRQTALCLEIEERNFRESLWRSKEAHFRQVIEEMNQNNIWPVTKWWQGNRQMTTPALRGAGGVKITDPVEKAKLLHRAWFPLPGDRSVALAMRLKDNLAGPTQDSCEDWMPYLIKAFLKLLARKAPGISGIKYMHYRELEGQTVARILSIIQSHLNMGTSPQVWKEQIVTVLVKPD